MKQKIMKLFKLMSDLSDFSDFSDVYIVNTCTVTGMSDKKSRQILRRAKQINPNSIVCAVGCYVQVSKEEIEKIEDIDILLGTIEKKDILKVVEEKLSDGLHKLILSSYYQMGKYEKFKK